VIQTAAKGPYFSISGNWCWITDNYPKEQTFLEYFFEFFSAGVGFLLYIAILLRVRGNLYYVEAEEKWHLRTVPSGQSWQLAFGRDLIDSSMLRAAKHMVWYPVAYTIILVPISFARLIEFGGGTVPDQIVIIADVLYNLTGFINVMVFLGTRRFFPDVAGLPEFTTPRKDIRASFVANGGVSPFPFPSTGAGAGEVSEKEKEKETMQSRSSRRFSVSTLSTVSGLEAEAEAPVRLPERVFKSLFWKRGRG